MPYTGRSVYSKREAFTVGRAFPTFRLAVLFAMFAALTATMGGCAASEKRQLAQQYVSLSMVQDTIVTLHASKVISDDTVLKSKPLVKAAREALDTAEQYLQAGNTSDFRLRLKQAVSLIRCAASLYGGNVDNDDGG